MANYWKAAPAMVELIRFNRNRLWAKCGGDADTYAKRLLKLKLRGFPI